jgi:hypothetical protein
MLRQRGDQASSKKEFDMLLHLPIAILATFSPITVSDTVPKFDTVRECSFEDGPSVDVARCSRDEAAALRQLQEAWAQYSGADRKACTAEATIGGFASYVDLLSCLEMARDAESANDNSRGPSANPELRPMRSAPHGVTVGVGDGAISPGNGR